MSNQNILKYPLFIVAVIFGFALAPLAGAVVAEPVKIGRFVSEDGSVILDVRSTKTEVKGGHAVLPLNKLVSLQIEVMTSLPGGPGAITNLTFDARMPGHDHGMVVKPQVSRENPSRFIVRGVKLHMGGAWELRFKLESPASTISIRAPYEL